MDNPETGNIWYARRRQEKQIHIRTLYVLDTTMRKQTQIA